MAHHASRVHLLLLLLGCCASLSTAFLGIDLGLWGSSDVPWDVCGGPDHCSCSTDLLLIMSEGLDCTHRHVQSLAGNMVVPVRFTHVDFSGNNISAVYQATFLNNNTHVTSLDLSANRMVALETDVFANLPNLVSLDLSNNLIANISELSLGSLFDLQYLDLSYNRIMALPDNLFSDKLKLTEISLEYNPIKSLSNTIFHGLHALRRLDLTYLRLSTLHEQTFRNLSIEDLSLVHNNFKLIPTKALFQLAGTLKKLDISGNSLEVIPAYALYNLHQLKELRMEQMIYLSTIEAYAFNALSSLQTVVIRYLPKIKYIDEKAFVGTINNTEVRSPVQDFTFSYTIMTNLPEALLDWEQVKYLDLHNNRWKCDCQFAWVKGSKIEKLIGDEIYCSSPTRVRGSLITWLKKEEFVCRSVDNPPEAREWGIIVVICLIGLLGSLTTVGILFYRRHGFLCRPPTDYNKLSAQSRESITVLDNTAVTASDAEINSSTIGQQA